MNWLDIDFQVEMVPNTSEANAAVRAFIIVETTALGSAFAPQQFFVDNATFPPIAQRDRTNRNASRYVVLWDSGIFGIGNPRYNNGTTTMVAAGGGLPSLKGFSQHIPLNFTTDYSRGNAGTYADIDTNSLWLVVTSDCSTTDLNVFGAWTTCFTDSNVK